MKTVADLAAMQAQHTNTRQHKNERSQRFTKQLSQGSSQFATKTNAASSKSILKLSENSQIAK